VNITYRDFVKKFLDINPAMIIDSGMNFTAEIIAGRPGRKKMKMRSAMTVG